MIRACCWNSVLQVKLDTWAALDENNDRKIVERDVEHRSKKSSVTTNDM
jgi:hypothetical protein